MPLNPVLNSHLSPQVRPKFRKKTSPRTKSTPSCATFSRKILAWPQTMANWPIPAPQSPIPPSSPSYPGFMKELALEALDSAQRPGVTYADVRIIASRDRELGTKNGKPGQVSSDESVGIGIRVL